MAIQVVVNPFSRGQLGRVAKKMVEQIASQYPNAQFLVSETSEFGFTADILPECCDSQMVCFIGGDSTARLMAQTSLACKEKDTRFSYIPSGLGNDFGQQFLKGLTRRNMKKVLPRYLQSIAENKLKYVSLDTLMLNDSCVFLSSFALGMDANVACSYHRFRKSRAGKLWLRVPLVAQLYYFFSALRFGLKRSVLDKCALRVRSIGSNEMRDISLKNRPITIQVTNTMYYGGARISQDSLPNDGIFEVTVIRNFGHLMALFLTKLLPCTGGFAARILEQYQTSEVNIDVPDIDIDFHIDGEAATAQVQPYRSIVIKIGPKFDMCVPCEYAKRAQH